MSLSHTNPSRYFLEYASIVTKLANELPWEVYSTCSSHLQVYVVMLEYYI